MPHLWLRAAVQRFISQEMHSLKRAMAKNEKSWSGEFAGRKFTRILLPWNLRD